MTRGVIGRGAIGRFVRNLLLLEVAAPGRTSSSSTASVGVGGTAA